MQSEEQKEKKKLVANLSRRRRIVRAKTHRRSRSKPS
jgi:hypothetical protein